MTADEFAHAAKVLFTDAPGWQARTAAALGIDPGSVSRYVSRGGIPGPVAACMGCWLKVFWKAQGRRPPIHSSNAAPLREHRKRTKVRRSAERGSRT